MINCIFNTSLGGIIAHETEIIKTGSFFLGLYSETGDYFRIKYDGGGTITVNDSVLGETVIAHSIDDGDRIGLEQNLSTGDYRIILKGIGESEIHSGNVLFSGDCIFSDPCIFISSQTDENGFFITTYSSGAKDVNGVLV